MEAKYQLIVNFADLKDLKLFLNDILASYGDASNVTPEQTTPPPPPTKTKPKKENDRRGKHVSLLHDKTRKWLEANPNSGLNYRQAFQKVNSSLDNV